MTREALAEAISEPTQTGRKVLAFASAYIAEHGYSPTIQEIGDAVGLASKASVFAVLHKLRQAGHVTWIDGQRRTLRLVEAYPPEQSDDTYLRLPRAVKDRLAARAQRRGVTEAELIALILDALEAVDQEVQS